MDPDAFLASIFGGTIVHRMLGVSDLVNSQKILAPAHDNSFIDLKQNGGPVRNVNSTKPLSNVGPPYLHISTLKP